MSDPSDADLLKKRARRRLVGAVAFAGLAAVVLPMVMDDEPKQQIQDVQIRIPGQEQAAFAPKLNRARGEAVEAAPKAAERVAEKAPEKRVNETPADKKPVEKPAEKVAEKAPEKAPEKAADKPVEKVTEKAAEKTAEKARAPESKAAEKSPEEAHRAAAILSGKHVEPPHAAASANSGQFVILIGAFSNSGNVKLLQNKLGELGLKVFTEPLDSPDGKKIRVRAGPFPSREAADKAAEKMKRIGVNGVVAAKP